MPQDRTQQQLNHHANQLNKNEGTRGTNPANAAVQGNRGAQMNPNNPRGNNYANPPK